MKIFSKMALAALMAVGFVGCAGTTIGNAIIGEKNEVELTSSVIVGKTTKKEVYEMYGEPTKSFGKINAAMIGKGTTDAAILHGRIDNEEYKVSNPKTTSLIMYMHQNAKNNSYNPLAGIFMDKEVSTTIKAFYIGFDENDIVSERWYSTQKIDGTKSAF